MSVIHWSSDSRQKLWFECTDPPPLTATPAQLFRQITQNFKNFGDWEAGVGRTLPRLRPAVKEGLQKIRDQAPHDRNALREAIVVLLLGLQGSRDDRPSKTKRQRVQQLVNYWVSCGGASFALEVIAKLSTLTVIHDWMDNDQRIGYEGSDDESSWQSLPLGLALWAQLNAQVQVLSDAEQANLWSVWGSQRSDLPLAFRCGLSFLRGRTHPCPEALEEGTEWLEADLAACLQQKRSGYYQEIRLPPFVWLLLPVLHQPEQIDRLFAAVSPFAVPAEQGWVIVASLGVEAVPHLQRLIEGYKERSEAYGNSSWLGTVFPELVGALALVESLRVAQYLSQYLLEKSLTGIIMDYFQRFPHLALQVLPELSRGKLGQAAETVLKRVVRLQPEVVQGALASLPDPQRQKMATLLAQTQLQVPEARADRLPPVLVTPPWQDAQTREPVVLKTLSPLAWEASLQWGDREPPSPYVYDRPPQLSTPEREAKALEELNQAVKHQKSLHLWELDRYPDGAVLQFWNTANPKIWYFGATNLDFLLARFGLEALPGLLKVFKRQPVAVAQTLQYAIVPEVAVLMADGLVRLKQVRPLAQGWLADHPEVAAIGLIPEAVGPLGKPRSAAIVALRYLDTLGQREILATVAHRYGDGVWKALLSELQSDPLLDFPAKRPSLPEFWQPEQFPRPLLKDKQAALPSAAVEILGTMLAFSPLDPAYAGLAQVRQWCDRDSLADFAWALFENWLTAGAPSKEQWAFSALAHLGNDQTAHRLTALIRQWPKEGGHARATTGLGILARMESEMALIHLHHLSQGVKYKSLQTKAKEQLQQVARLQKLSAEELADRLVPDLGLDAQGRCQLDYGERQFIVRFDEYLQPYLQDSTGKPLKSLPKPRKSEDPLLASQANDHWKTLKKDAKTIAEQQILRLEQAMLQQRRWDVQGFRTYLWQHPFLTHLVQRFVWGLYDDQNQLQQTFRVSEDGSLSDREDEEWNLPEAPSAASEAGSGVAGSRVAGSRDKAWRIGLPHALELEPPVLQQWSLLFADYEILQPWPQLNRPTYHLTPEQQTAKILKTWEGHEVSLGRVLALEKRGWRKGEAWDSGWAGEFLKPIAGSDLVAILQLEPGICLVDLRESGDPQKIHHLYLQQGNQYKTAMQIEFTALETIAASELLYDLHCLDEALP
ncbi:MAG: DUF4132 domain-containing protein [Prochlorotrichaceae cyanobacterium]|jgi:hypothetical protein